MTAKIGNVFFSNIKLKTTHGQKVGLLTTSEICTCAILWLIIMTNRKFIPIHKFLLSYLIKIGSEWIIIIHSEHINFIVVKQPVEYT